MPVTTTAALITDARVRSGAVGAFNVITLEHVEGVLQGAQAAGYPVILQVSENAVRFHGGHLLPLARAAHAAAEICTIPVALHLDHVTDPELLHHADQAGFSSAMFDAGNAAYADNVSATSAAVRWAHANGLWLEAELGYVGGKPDAPRSAHAAGTRTVPAEAAAFVEATGVDALAVAVGSSHAMITQTATLDHDLIADLAAAVNVPLVLHGSSGVDHVGLGAAIAAGMRKINIGTALNVAYTGAVRTALHKDSQITDPRKYLNAARDAIADTVTGLLTAINAQPLSGSSQHTSQGSD